ncbi:MAG: hypothetical protein M0Z47_10810 [Actinomycetota bacterium]|nr:hypothetical protein [Actinomycetota bacterium]
MALAMWVNADAVAAGTAYKVPAAAGLPPNATMIGIRSLVIAPLASAGAASTTSPTQETGTANNTTAPGAGTVSVQTGSQELVSGDAIPADAVVTANVILSSEQPLNP